MAANSNLQIQGDWQLSSSCVNAPVVLNAIEAKLVDQVCCQPTWCPVTHLQSNWCC